jgi:hypothetical protein
MRTALIRETRFRVTCEDTKTSTTYGMGDARVCLNMKNGNVETIAFGDHSLLSVETTVDKTTLRSMMGGRLLNVVPAPEQSVHQSETCSAPEPRSERRTEMLRLFSPRHCALIKAPSGSSAPLAYFTAPGNRTSFSNEAIAPSASSSP